MHRAAPTVRSNPVQTVSSAEADKPFPRVLEKQTNAHTHSYLSLEVFAVIIHWDSVCKYIGVPRAVPYTSLDVIFTMTLKEISTS